MRILAIAMYKNLLRLFPGLLVLLAVLALCPARAQSLNLYGITADASTGEHLAFVHVLVKGKHSGQLTDINGQWLMENLSPADTLVFTYIGYAGKAIPVKDLKTSTSNTIYLRAEDINLHEVVITPGTNPADRIVQAVLDHKRENNWERIPQFSYISYNRLHITASAMADTLKLQEDTSHVGMTDTTSRPDGKAKDSVLSNKSDTASLDSFVQQSHFFLTESVVETQFMYPEKRKETILAAKISGIADPAFSFLASQFNSFNIYKDYIDLAQTHYLSPIAYGALGRYVYQIEDTLWSADNDTIFVISFHPHKKKLFNGFKGLMYVSSKGYAVQNIILQPVIKEDFNLRIRQEFQYINGQHWFPVKMNADYIFSNIAKGRRMIGVGRSYNEQISFSTDLKKKDFNNIVISVDPDAMRKDSAYWAKARLDSLSEQDKRTYHIIDSISKKEHLEQRLEVMKNLSSSQIPIGPLNLDLDKILAVNAYEGYRLGLGLHTNNRISHWFSIGGYGDYGTRDKQWKYGGDLSITPFKASFFQLKGTYTNDIHEFGGVSWAQDRKKRPDERYHWLSIANMYYSKSYEGSVRWMMLRYLQVQAGFGRSTAWMLPKYMTAPYIYARDDYDASAKYPLAEARFGFRYAYREKWADDGTSKISMGTRYPIFWVDVLKGFKNVAGGAFDYLRVDAKVEKSFVVKLGGNASFQLRGGKVWGDVPLFKLYTLEGNNSEKTLRFFNANSFQTMKSTEFAADRYAALFFTYDFESLIFHLGKQKPLFKIYQSMAFGSLQHPTDHIFPFKVPSKGYYESGIGLDKLYSAKLFSYGLAVFYRYGPYTLPKMKDNFALLLTLTSPFIN